MRFEGDLPGQQAGLRRRAGAGAATYRGCLVVGQGFSCSRLPAFWMSNETRGLRHGRGWPSDLLMPTHDAIGLCGYSKT